jgi:hypothetical protein
VPASWGHRGRDPHVNLVRLCYALVDLLPPGYHHPPLRSQTWIERTAGRPAAFFEDLDTDELTRLIEGLKAIYWRAQQAAPETPPFQPGRRPASAGSTAERRSAPATPPAPLPPLDVPF